MRYTVVPQPGDVARLDTVWETLPGDPTPETDCCGRIVDGTDIESRDVGREWLVFLHALDCVSKDDGTYYRTQRPSSQAAVGATFSQQIFGADEILQTFESTAEPLSTTAVLDHLDESTRNRLTRTGDPTAYVERVLGWAVEFDLLWERGDEYERG